MDYLFRVPAFPASDTKCEFEELTVQGGGPVATALVLLARWGVRARFAGVVGDDDFGRAILQGLRTENVGLSATVVRREARSQVAFVCVERATGRRTIFWGRPEARPYGVQDLPPDFLKGVAALHLDGLFGEVSIHLARQARALRIPVVLDAGSLRPNMLDLIRYTDHLIASERFARQFSPRTSLARAVGRLKRLGPEVVVVTAGQHGSVGLWADRPCWLPALSVKVRDTTGAGDVFHGAYIYGLIRGWHPADRLRWATVSAGLSCTRLGGRAGIPSQTTVRRRLSDLGDFAVRGVLGPR